MLNVVKDMVVGEYLLHNKECVINNILFICEFAKTVYSNETKDYLHLTKQVTESCTDHDLTHQSMVIGSSTLTQYEIDGAVGMYSGIFNNPFMIWGKYKRAWFRTTQTVSFQFHHTQMNGAHASRFLEQIQKEIDKMS